jgi:hypothetical protein
LLRFFGRNIRNSIAEGMATGPDVRADMGEALVSHEKRHDARVPQGYPIKMVDPFA